MAGRVRICGCLAEAEIAGFAAGDAWDRLADYLTIFPLILPSAGTFARARAFHTEYGWSFWDAMIVAACLECGVTRLYTEDVPGSAVRGPLEIVNPFL
jgi:predicted nucleic acid-binding protein